VSQVYVKSMTSRAEDAEIHDEEAHQETRQGRKQTAHKTVKKQDPPRYRRKQA
jgi:hypothetical protein